MTQTRRQFLLQTTAASAGMALTGMQMPLDQPKATAGFELIIYATRWGFRGSMDEFCRRVKEEGYDGVEDWLPGDKAQEEALFEALEKYNLRFGLLAGSGGDTFDQHMKSYAANLDRALERKPDFINCHAGRDFFSFDQARQIIESGKKKSKDSGIPVYQETHRSRMLFAAHVCERILDEIPGFQLTLDISHWCVVAESLLGNQPLAVKKALQRTAHIHSRIGHEEGPQVSESRAPEWQRARDAHFAWWDEIVAMKKAAGERLTMTTEFGPPNYMWTTTYTYQPVADQWAINVDMMNEWRKRYL